MENNKLNTEHTKRVAEKRANHQRENEDKVYVEGRKNCERQNERREEKRNG